MKTVTREIGTLTFIATQSKHNRKTYTIDVISHGEVESSDEWIELTQTIEDYLDYLVRYNSNTDT